MRSLSESTPPFSLNSSDLRKESKTITIATLFLAVLPTPQVRGVMTLTMSLTIGMYVITRINEALSTQNKKHIFPLIMRILTGIIAVFILIVSPYLVQINRGMILAIGLTIGIYIITQIVRVWRASYFRKSLLQSDENTRVQGLFEQTSLPNWDTPPLCLRILAGITLAYCFLAMLLLWNLCDMSAYEPGSMSGL